MHLPHKQSDQITDLGARLREATEALLRDIPATGDDISLQDSTNLFAQQPEDRLFLLTEGQAYYRVGGKLVMHLGAGDLLGLSRALELPTGTYGSEGSVTLLPFTHQQLLKQARQTPARLWEWSRYLVSMSCFYRAALAQEIRAEFQPSAGFAHYRAGETIIHQGAEADRVYTLLEGSADAMRDGVKVGEIHADEIFGALAVFTRQKRMASVVATSDCTLLVVRKEEFVDLIELQPQICMGLIEEMASKINQLNEQVSALDHRHKTVKSE